MDFKNITIHPDLIVDIVLYVLIGVLLCVISKIVYDWKENRRLKKEFAEYQQMKEDEAADKP